MNKKMYVLQCFSSVTLEKSYLYQNLKAGALSTGGNREWRSVERDQNKSLSSRLLVHHNSLLPFSLLFSLSSEVLAQLSGTEQGEQSLYANYERKPKRKVQLSSFQELSSMWLSGGTCGYLDFPISLVQP